MTKLAKEKLCSKDLKCFVNDIFFAGGLSGGIGRLILQPLDVAKIRMQLQVLIDQKLLLNNTLKKCSR